MTCLQIPHFIGLLKSLLRIDPIISFKNKTFGKTILLYHIIGDIGSIVMTKKLRVTFFFYKFTHIEEKNSIFYACDFLNGGH